MLSADDAARLAACLATGGVALFPADTVYGLACDPLRADAVRRLYELKGRPPTQPAAVMFFALAPALATLPEVGPCTRLALERLLPGPLTVLLANPAERFPLAGRPEVAFGGASGGAENPGPEGTALGLRVPLLPPALAALAALREPVLQSSANLSGGVEARRLADVDPAVRAGADLVLDGGELPGIASTVLDLRRYEDQRHWRVVRAGPLGAAQLRRVLG